MSLIPFGETFFGDGSLQSDNMDAINRYIGSTEKPKTAAATKLRDEWIVWHDGLGWYERSFTPNIYDMARNRKLAYDLANLTTAVEKAAFKETIAAAFTTEETRGKANRRLADGTYSAKQSDVVADTSGVLGMGEEAFFPLRVKIAAAVSVAGIAALWIAKKVYLDPFIPSRTSVKTKLAEQARNLYSR